MTVKQNRKRLRARIQVYGQHEADTFEVIRLMREMFPTYMTDEGRGPRWPDPTEANRCAMAFFVAHLSKKAGLK